MANGQAQRHVKAEILNVRNSGTTHVMWDIKKSAVKGYSYSFTTAFDMSAVSLLESREERYIKAITNGQSKHRGVEMYVFGTE